MSDANKLVQVYIKIRDAKDIKKKQMEAEIAELEVQLDAVEQELLELCKATGQDGGKTTFGSFTRSVKHGTGPLTGTVCTSSSVSMTPLTCLNAGLRRVTSRSSSRRILSLCLQV